METFLRRNVMRRFWISDQCHYDPTWDIFHNMLTQYYFSDDRHELLYCLL